MLDLGRHVTSYICEDPERLGDEPHLITDYKFSGENMWQNFQEKWHVPDSCRYSKLLLHAGKLRTLSQYHDSGWQLTLIVGRGNLYCHIRKPGTKFSTDMPH